MLPEDVCQKCVLTSLVNCFLFMQVEKKNLPSEIVIFMRNSEILKAQFFSIHAYMCVWERYEQELSSKSSIDLIDFTWC